MSAILQQNDTANCALVHELENIIICMKVIQLG